MEESRIITFDHDNDDVFDACGISKTITKQINALGMKHFKALTKEGTHDASLLIKRAIMNTRLIVGKDPDAPITEYEVSLCVYLHMVELALYTYETMQ